MESLICWLSSISGEDLKNLFVSIPGIFLTGFSIYFAYQKIGNKVLVSYSIHSGRTTEERIGALELINEKNKPVSIFSIHAVINQDLVFEIDSYETPLILKPLESVKIETPKYSAAYLGIERYKPDFCSPNKIDIYLITSKKKIRCITTNPPSINARYDLGHYRKIIKDTRIFNGMVYNEKCKYAITYRLDSEDKTAFIEDWGFITDCWEFEHRQIPDEYMSSKERVVEYLKLLGYDKFFERVTVDDLK